ncbi:hypothetical protein [Clostridium sp.]|uniref:hypothetical protein n=1 Tax=Clostridium sp. TaxID=1506 RepID=UPI0032168C03
MQRYEYYPNITGAKPLVDILKDKDNVEIDYLLKLKKKDKFIRIQHEQEIPKYKNVHMIEIDDIQLDEEVKKKTNK